MDVADQTGIVVQGAGGRVVTKEQGGERGRFAGHLQPSGQEIGKPDIHREQQMHNDAVRQGIEPENRIERPPEQRRRGRKAVVKTVRSGAGRAKRDVSKGLRQTMMVVPSSKVK